MEDIRTDCCDVQGSEEHSQDGGKAGWTVMFGTACPHRLKPMAKTMSRRAPRSFDRDSLSIALGSTSMLNVALALRLPSNTICSLESLRK